MLLEKEEQIANLLEEKEYFISNLERFARELSEAKEALQEEGELAREKNDLIQQLTLDNSKLKAALQEQKAHNGQNGREGKERNEGRGKAYLDVKNMVQVRGQYPKSSEVKSMDGNRDSALQQSRSTANLKSQCGASSQNRLNVLSNQWLRKESLAEVKQLLREINNPEISHRLNSLISEVYLDAEYRERTNVQLK